MFTIFAKFRALPFTAALLAGLALSCSGLGDPVIEPDPPPTIKPPATTFAPLLPTRGDTTVREGEILELLFSASDPDSLGVVYVVQGPGAFSGAEWAWRPGFDQAGPHAVRVIAHVPGHPEWADTAAFTVLVLDDPQPGPRLALLRDTTILENQLLVLTLAATDPRNTGVTYFMAGPVGASLVATQFSWRPGYAQAGVHDLVFRVADKGAPARRDSLRVRVTVQNVDRPPVLQAVRDTTIDTSMLLRFTLSATDPDGDSITYSMPGRPSGASLTGAVFLWKPTESQADPNAYTLRAIATAKGLSDTVTVVIQVTLPTVGGPPDPVPVPLPAPVAYWSFDDGTATAAPSQPGGRPISLAGGVTRVPGVSGQAVRFNGTAAQYGESATAFPDMTEQTLAAWVHADSLDRTTITLIQESNNASGRDNELSIERPAGSTTWKFMYRTRDDDGRHFSNGSLAARKWYYLAGVTTRDTVRLYINGVLDKIITSPAPFNLSGNHYRIQLARKNDGSTIYPYNLRGSLDEIKLFDKALTAPQIQDEWERHKTAAGY